MSIFDIPDEVLWEMSQGLDGILGDDSNRLFYRSRTWTPRPGYKMCHCGRQRYNSIKYQQCYKCNTEKRRGPCDWSKGYGKPIKIETSYGTEPPKIFGHVGFEEWKHNMRWGIAPRPVICPEKLLDTGQYARLLARMADRIGVATKPKFPPMDTDVPYGED